LFCSVLNRTDNITDRTINVWSIYTIQDLFVSGLNEDPLTREDADSMQHDPSPSASAPNDDDDGMSDMMSGGHHHGGHQSSDMDGGGEEHDHHMMHEGATQAPPPTPLQPETRAITSWTRANKFVLSVSLWAGTVAVVYPYNTPAVSIAGRRVYV